MNLFSHGCGMSQNMIFELDILKDSIFHFHSEESGLKVL